MVTKLWLVEEKCKKLQKWQFLFQMFENLPGRKMPNFKDTFVTSGTSCHLQDILNLSNLLIFL